VLIAIGLQIENRPTVHPKFKENVAKYKDEILQKCFKYKYFKYLKYILNTLENTRSKMHLKYKYKILKCISDSILDTCI